MTSGGASSSSPCATDTLAPVRASLRPKVLPLLPSPQPAPHTLSFPPLSLSLFFRSFFSMLLPLLALAPLASTVAAQTWAPTTAACPPGLEIVRPAGSVLFQNQTLNPEEVAYVAERRNTTGRAAFAAYYKTVEAAFPVDSNQKLPRYVETILTSKLDAVRSVPASAAAPAERQADRASPFSPCCSVAPVWPSLLREEDTARPSTLQAAWPRSTLGRRPRSRRVQAVCFRLLTA